MAVSKDNILLLTRNKQVFVINLNDYSVKTVDASKSPNKDNIATAVDWSPDGTTFVTGYSKTGALDLWDATDLSLMHTFDRGDGQSNPRCTGAKFSPSGEKLISSYMDSTIRVWQLAKCKQHQSFADGSCKTFTLDVDPTRASSESTYSVNYTDPESTEFMAVGQTYYIAPKTILRDTTVPSVGSVSDFRYRLSSGDPQQELAEGLFMKSKNGQIQASFDETDAGSTYKIAIHVLDAGGAQRQLDNFSISVMYRDVDHPNSKTFGPNGKPCENGGEMVDDADEFDEKYTCDCSNIPYEGTNCQTWIECSTEKSFADGVCKAFVVSKGAARERIDTKLYTDPSSNITPFFAVGDTYRISPLSMLEKGTTPSQGDAADISYEISCTSADGTSPNQFAVRANDGDVLITFAAPDANKTFTMRTTVVDAGDAEVALENISFAVRYRDTDEEMGPAALKLNGPGNDGCYNNGTMYEPEPINEFDNSYLCRCKAPSASCDADSEGDFTGPNCNVKDTTRAEACAATAAEAATEAAASASETARAKKSLTGAIAAAVSVVMLVLVGFAAKRYYTYWLSIQPLDFEKELARMIASGDIHPDDGRRESMKLIPREINRRSLHLVEQVGQGQFGQVWKGILDEAHSRGTPAYTIAAKTVKDAANNPEGAQDLVAEATVMMQVSGHPNLVSIIGVITAGDPLVLVLQYCEHGSALGYLKKMFAAGKAVTVEAKMAMASEIAKGMAHLAKLQFIHRDLAARNVLLTSGLSKSGIVCKVADFGLSRGANNEDSESSADYYKSSSGVFPVRWTAPEAMETLKFSPASDVWSFGIVVIELFQDGERPYQGKSNPDVMKLTMSGGRHAQPDGCSDAVYAELLKCWDAEASARPSFLDLHASFVTFSAPKVAPRMSAVGGMQATAAAAAALGGDDDQAENEYADGFGFGDDEVAVDPEEQQETNKDSSAGEANDAGAASATKKKKKKKKTTGEEKGAPDKKKGKGKKKGKAGSNPNAASPDYTSTVTNDLPSDRIRLQTPVNPLFDGN